MRVRELELKADGRQSPIALAVARGVRRLLRSLGYSTLPEVALAAPEDLQDSHERLQEVLHWVVQA